MKLDIGYKVGVYKYLSCGVLIVDESRLVDGIYSIRFGEIPLVLHGIKHYAELAFRRFEKEEYSLEQLASYLNNLSQCRMCVVSVNVDVRNAALFSEDNVCEIISGDAFQIGTQVIIQDVVYNGVVMYKCKEVAFNGKTYSFIGEQRTVLEDSMRLLWNHPYDRNN